MHSSTFVCFANKNNLYIYIMLKINVLDSTKYSQRFTKEFVNTYLVLSVAYKIITVKQRTSNMAGRLAVKIIFNNNNVQ